MHHQANFTFVHKIAGPSFLKPGEDFVASETKSNPKYCDDVKICEQSITVKTPSGAQNLNISSLHR